MSRVLTTSDGRPVSDDNPLPVKGVCGGGSANWDDIEDKPSEFAPSPHTHEIGDVDGLSSELDSKANQSNLDSLESTIDDLSANISDLQSTIDDLTSRIETLEGDDDES